MKDEDFRSLRTYDTGVRWKLCDEKSIEYTRGNKDDRLVNFRNRAEELGLSWEIAWAVYFMKHVDAILEYCKTGKKGSEGIRSRIYDSQNYLDLLLGKVSEDELIAKALDS